MKKKVKSALCIVLAVLTIIPSLTGLFDCDTANAETLTEFAFGDKIEFGSYPQSQVKSFSVLNALNSIDADWKSYGYYLDGKVSDFMEYCDVVYKGNKYRGVSFSEYRQLNCPWWYSDYDSVVQKYNGYYSGKVYWFKYEPVEWIIIDPVDGKLLSADILDNQPFREFYYTNSSNYKYADKAFKYSIDDYALSTVRTFLNDLFYNTVFSSSEKEIIVTTSVKRQEGWISDKRAVKDNVYLLDKYEIFNSSYNFSDDDNILEKGINPPLMAYGTDYAKCQGLDVCSGNQEDFGNSYAKGYSPWLLRADDCITSAGIVCGYSSDNIQGIRPVITVDLNNAYFSEKYGKKSVTKTVKKEIVLGDIDFNGSVSIADARNVLRYAINLDAPSTSKFAAADINKNKLITVEDARRVLRAALGSEVLGSVPELTILEANYLAAFPDVLCVLVDDMGMVNYNISMKQKYTLGGDSSYCNPLKDEYSSLEDVKKAVNCIFTKEKTNDIVGRKLKIGEVSEGMQKLVIGENISDFGKYWFVKNGKFYTISPGMGEIPDLHAKGSKLQKIRKGLYAYYGYDKINTQYSEIGEEGEWFHQLYISYENGSYKIKKSAWN